MEKEVLEDDKADLRSQFWCKKQKNKKKPSPYPSSWETASWVNLILRNSSSLGAADTTTTSVFAIWKNK